MTADIRTAGAASHAAEGWHTINWKSAYRIVCRLQARIVKAIQEGRWGKVKALQYLLTYSFSGKALAIRRVTENQGKGTPGVDREIWDTPEKKATALQALRQRGYNPQPLRRVYIPKKNGKMRPLGIPTMRDRAMQALYLQALDPIAETMADPNSYGFRKERSTADAIEQCHIVLSNRGGARWIFEGDIKSCFDRISHEWLMAQFKFRRFQGGSRAARRVKFPPANRSWRGAGGRDLRPKCHLPCSAEKLGELGDPGFQARLFWKRLWHFFLVADPPQGRQHVGKRWLFLLPVPRSEGKT